MVKLTNPFDYPIAILVGGIVLVVGVRFWRVPNLVILPGAAIVATATALSLKSREPDPEKAELQDVERELTNLKASGRSVAEKAAAVRSEAGQLLGHDGDYLELLVRIEEVCSPIAEIPTRIEALGQRLPQNNSVLSLAELEADLHSAHALLVNATGVARQQAEELVESLEKNRELAKTGSSVNLAKLLNLRVILQNTAGILQELQNKIRLLNRPDLDRVREVEELCERLQSTGSNLDILIH
jgi:vacuolar-type H+-ATPase subunit I/STV1